MQINLKIWLIFCFSCVLTSCADTYSDDTRYELIQGGFPRLGDVPNRPTHPSPLELDKQQQLLLRSTQEAEALKQKTFNDNAMTNTEMSK